MADMHVQVRLVDINPKMIAAWRDTFEANPEVEIVHGSMIDQDVSAWVSPTNSGGRMDGGLDGVIKTFLGPGIEHAVQKQIGQRYGGAMPVGHATCVATGRPSPRFLISTPTMVASNEDVSDTMNVVLAAAAAFQAVRMQNAAQPGSIASVALPGLGANTGRVPPEICADLMWTAYDLFRTAELPDFAAVRLALEQMLGDLGPTSSHGAYKKSYSHIAGAVASGAVAGAPKTTPAPKKPQKDALDEDFDEDFDDDDFDDEDDLE